MRGRWEKAGCPDDWYLFRGRDEASYCTTLHFHFKKAMEIAGLRDENGNNLFWLHDMRRADPNVEISPADYAKLLGNTEKVAIAHYMNAPRAETEIDKAKLIALLESLAPKPPLLLEADEYHESTMIAAKTAETKDEN